jgi:hypothetical protein
MIDCRFRWVQCQLDSLWKCLTVSAIRKALSKLPRTLDETYRRILADIPAEYGRKAHMIFQLLSVSYEPLTLETIVETVAIDTENHEFVPEARLANEEDILDICGGLVVFVEKFVCSPDLIDPDTRELIMLRSLLSPSSPPRPPPGPPLKLSKYIS